MSKPRKYQLIIEKDGDKLWGRVTVEGNLIVDSAKNISALESKIRGSIKEFESLEEVIFEYAYDLTFFFEEFNFLNQSKIAEIAGIHPSLIRQYSSGHKLPSKEQVAKIEVAIRELATKLKSVKLSSKHV